MLIEEEVAYLEMMSRRLWAPAVDRAHISPAPTFHHLRHTAAALAIAEGAHPKAIQALMGHASITTTLNVYGHLFPSLDVELADRLEAVRADALAARLRHVDRRRRRRDRVCEALTCGFGGGRGRY